MMSQQTTRLSRIWNRDFDQRMSRKGPVKGTGQSRNLEVRLYSRPVGEGGRPSFRFELGCQERGDIATGLPMIPTGLPMVPINPSGLARGPCHEDDRRWSRWPRGLQGRPGPLDRWV